MHVCVHYTLHISMLTPANGCYCMYTCTGGGVSAACFTLVSSLGLTLTRHDGSLGSTKGIYQRNYTSQPSIQEQKTRPSTAVDQEHQVTHNNGNPHSPTSDKAQVLFAYK